MSGPVTRRGAETQQTFNSTLPWYRKKIEQELGLVRLTCMRSGCGESMWLQQHRYPEKPTAPCPSCSKVSRLPELEAFDLSEELAP